MQEVDAARAAANAARQALAGNALVDLKVPTPRAREGRPPRLKPTAPADDAAGDARRSRRRSLRLLRRSRRRRAAPKAKVSAAEANAAWKQAYANDENEEPTEAEKAAAEKAPAKRKLLNPKRSRRSSFLATLDMLH